MEDLPTDVLRSIATSVCPASETKFWTREDMMACVATLRCVSRRVSSGLAAYAEDALVRNVDRQAWPSLKDAFFKRKVTVRTAMRAYGLSKSDVDTLFAAPDGAGHAPSGSYPVPEAQMRRLAIRVHGGEDGAEAAVERKTDESLRKRDRWRKARERRTRKLEKALADVGCELRTDSRLCNRYLRRGKGDVAQIASVMREMQFFFDCTEYHSLFPVVAARIKAVGGSGFRYDRDAVSREAKEEALRRWVVEEGGSESHPDLPGSLVPMLRSVCENEA